MIGGGSIYEPYTATSYVVALVMRGTGDFVFIKGGAYANWTLLWEHIVSSEATLYIRIANMTATVSSDYVRVPRELWIPAPLISDGFTTAFGVTDGAGHFEATGLGSGGGGLTYTQVGTWGISTARANCTALAGGLGLAIAPCSNNDVIASVNVTRAAGAAGLVLRYTDANNYLYAYHDGTNAALIEKVGGADANVVAPTAKTYAAAARLRVVLSGASARLYYNEAIVGAVATTNILTGTGHGLWTNNTDPILDNLVVYARGAGGEYERYLSPPFC
jgi:hypothetical protein